MKRANIKRYTPLKASTTNALKRSGPLKKSGMTKAKKVGRQRKFYASAAWKTLRKEALERAGHRCEHVHRESGMYSSALCANLIGVYREVRCEETDRLHVHHKRNARFGGDERPSDLEVLCFSHHMQLHAREGKRIS